MLIRSAIVPHAGYRLKVIGRRRGQGERRRPPAKRDHRAEAKLSFLINKNLFRASIQAAKGCGL